MAWEAISKSSRGRGGAAAYGANWESLPAVAVNKGRLTMNQSFQNAYGFIPGDYVHLLIDRENFRIGFKKVATGESPDGAYRIQKRDDKKSERSLTITCHNVVKAFPDRIKHAYRAMLNPHERVIEVDLTKPFG